MGFYIPAEEAKKASAFPPGTGYHEVTIIALTPQDKRDKKGNNSYRCQFAFDNGARSNVFGSLPFEPDGSFVPAVAQLSQADRDKKVKGMVGALKEIFLSAGITEDYIEAEGMDTDHLEGRKAYIGWLGRPEDAPEGVKAYGDVDSWISKENFERYVAAGKVPEDNRQYPWRASDSTGSARAKSADDNLPAPPPPARSSNRLPPPRRS